jgi:hypothetical protein
MTTYDTAFNVLHALVLDATGLAATSIRGAYSNAPLNAPQNRDEAVVIINLLSMEPIGHDASRYENQAGIGEIDLTETIESDVLLTASIKVLGETAEDIAQKIKMAPQSAIGKNILGAGDLGFIRAGNIQNISQIQNGSYENRRQIDMAFHASIEQESIVRSIQSATITGDFYGSDKITTTIEVTK